MHRPLGGFLSRPLNKPPTLVYSCSGCGDVAQLANEVALRLDHGGVAGMSSPVGLG